MKKILITGGAGFIGSHVCKALALEGYTLLAVDNLIHGHANRVKWCPLKVGDIADATFIDPLLDDFKPDAIIHLAAHSNPVESVTHPQAYYRNNIVATAVLLDAMVRYRVKNIIFASSSAIYAEKPEHTPYVEQDRCEPRNPYSISKWTDEQLIKDFAQAYGLHYIIMRHFNPAGATSDGEIGELPAGNSHAIAALIQVALGMQPRFVFYGTDYSTHDGSSIRDYVHVEDIANAHIRALEYLTQKQESLIVNIGSGKGTSLKELIASAEQLCGHAINVEFKPRRDVHQAYLVSDISCAHQRLGWTLEHSSLDNILQTTLNWFKSARQT